MNMDFARLRIVIWPLHSITVGRKTRWTVSMLSRHSFGTIFAVAALAQASVMPELPKGPAKPGFDISRFALTAVGTFETFYVKESYPLRNVLDQRKVAPDTRLLVIETAAGRLALITDQMTYHHIAQGRVRNKDWMATF
jgi:hypothetical protein